MNSPTSESNLDYLSCMLGILSHRTWIIIFIFTVKKAMPTEVVEMYLLTKNLWFGV